MRQRDDALAILTICQTNECGNYRVGDRCKLFKKPCCIMTRLLRGEGCPMPEPRFVGIDKPNPKPIDLSPFVSTASDRLANVELVTIHYNTCRYNRLRETYSEWLPTLGQLADHVRCIELVFDDDEQEIEGSFVIRGTREKNLMWQKEALVNVALRQCDPSKKYFAWIDHDLVFENTNWLSDAVAKLDEGYKAVQLFSSVTRLNQDRTIQSSRAGAVASRHSGGKTSSNPGGAWIADRRYMELIGGLNIENLFGGGDQSFLDALIGKPGYHLREYSDRMSESLTRWIELAHAKCAGAKYDHIDGTAYHLWHGDPDGRQYATRYKVLKDSGFDPSLDIRLNADGLLEWCSHKPRLHREIARFFQSRREDG